MYIVLYVHVRVHYPGKPEVSAVCIEATCAEEGGDVNESIAVQLISLSSRRKFGSA